MPSSLSISSNSRMDTIMVRRIKNQSWRVRVPSIGMRGTSIMDNGKSISLKVLVFSSSVLVASWRVIFCKAGWMDYLE